MRTHFLKQGKKTTLCGARVLECGTPNAPVFTTSREMFDRILKQNRCIKCGQLLVRVDLLQRRKERHIHQEALWSEFLRRVDRAIELTKNQEPEQPGELLEEVEDEREQASAEGSTSAGTVERDGARVSSGQTSGG